MSPVKLGKLGSRTQWIQISGFCYFGNKPRKSSKSLAFNVLMNPINVGKMGFWTQVIWVNQVLEPS